MPPGETELDPIVEILRLAYRRGLAIQREQDRKNRAVMDEGRPNAEHIDPDSELENEILTQVDK